MNKAQRTIKYLAMAFAIFLVVTIIGTILTVIFTLIGITSVMPITDMNIETTNLENEYIDINEIEIDISSANIKIVKSDKLKINATNIPEEYKIIDKEDKLIITGTKVKSDAEITIYMPENVQKLNLEVGAGNVTIKDIVLKEMDLNIGAAKLEIANIEVLAQMDIETGVGQTKILNSKITNLDMETGIGNVEFEGYINGKSKIGCGIGNVEINLFGTENIYKINVERGIGNVYINNQKTGGKTTIGNGANILNISGGMGNLEITY